MEQEEKEEAEKEEEEEGRRMRVSLTPLRADEITDLTRHVISVRNWGFFSFFIPYFFGLSPKSHVFII